jgi:lysophospholipase L1-like esterase
MSRLSTFTRLAAFTSLAMAASCSSDKQILGPDVPPGGEIFRSYVALGNSITAGYQSGGINDSTQRQSYARLLAGSMGTQYHYASLSVPGCPAPLTNGLTGARVLAGTAVAPPCALRAGTSITDVLNNVAVPGMTSYDPTAVSTAASNALTTFILGGKTQAQRALDARPTFATIWVGNNDVLQPGLSGLYQPILSTPAQYQANMDGLLKALLDSEPSLKGVLIGVAKVQFLPSMVSGAYLFTSQNSATSTLSKAAGTAVQVLPTCSGSTSLVNVVSLIPAIKSYVASGGTAAGAHPPVITCSKNTPGLPAPVGDVYVLDAAEQVTLNATIDAYNSYLQAKAGAIGFAYYDPNILFAASRASGAIPVFPTYTCGTALGSCTAVSYGNLISLDAIHPSAATHILLANDLIGVINAKYGTTLAAVQ